MSSEQVILQTVTVAKNKGCVHILSFGGAPFALVDKRVKSTQHASVQALIPNGFRIRTTCSAREWELETRVLDSGAVEYMCICVEHPNVCGGWQKTASKTYVETNKELIALGLGNGKFRKNENGALLIGITYPNVQRALHAYLGQEREHLDPATTPLHVEPVMTPLFELTLDQEEMAELELPSENFADCQAMEELPATSLDVFPLEEEPPRKKMHSFSPLSFDKLDATCSQTNDYFAEYLDDSVSMDSSAWDLVL